MSFKNQVVLVTGASSGIGAAAAIAFAQEGASVIMVGRNQDKLRVVAEKCQTVGLKPLVIVADVSDDKDIKRIFSITIDHFGKLNILVNNAGTLSTHSILSENTMEVFDKILATNLRAAVYLTHLFAPYLIETKGNVVNVSSVTAISVMLNNCFAYTTSKAALDHFTRSTALELASKGVRVNSVNPGLVRTDLAQKLGLDSSKQDAFWDRLMPTAPLGKIGNPEEIADLILFIASDKGGSITGSSFVSDNGALLVPQIGDVKELGI